MKVKIDDIKFIEDLYPRDKFDNETVNNYRANVEALPPILLTKDYILVDGQHRLMAHRIEGHETIEVEDTLLNIEGDDIYIEAIKRNAFHGKQLTMTEKRTATRRLYKNNYRDSDIELLLGVSNRTIDSWTKDLKAAEREARNQEIIELYLQCYTQEEIAEKLKVAIGTVSNTLDNFKKHIIAENETPESLQLYNVWNFPRCDDRYGLQYPGRIPGQIIENLLYYYTEPFGKVVDPMAGGGTTIDVCKAINRRYLAYDIKPVRNDIQQHDIANGFPERAKSADLIILDPPYWRLKRDEYNAKSISTSSLDNWLIFIGNLAKYCRSTLRPQKYVGLILEAFNDEQDTHSFVDLPFLCLDLFTKAGFKELQRISVPMPSQIKSHHDIKYSKDNKVLLDLNRDLLVLQK